MESQSVPSHSGGGLGKKGWTAVMHGEKKIISNVKEESCPFIKVPVFTVTQLQELQQQTLIHSHIAAGLPVPCPLVLPIWKSVAAPFGASNFVRGLSPQGFNYTHMMEPEQGRCRRTDGKKWRCSKKVVAGQKYCEQHIHRGRQRSRKLVEASEISAPSNPTTTRPEKTKAKSPQNPSSNLLGLQLMTPSFNAANVSHGGTTITSNLSKKRVSYVTSPYITTNNTSGSGIITSTIATNNPNPVFTSTKSNQNIGKDMKVMYLANTSAIKGSSDNSKNVSVGRNMLPGLGFSPKSVLHGVVRRNDLCVDNRNGMEIELGRCRRTDGKKWRCRRDVIPYQKYCARHMHRGAKKLAKPIEPIASSATTNTAPLPIAAAAATATATATSCRTDRESPNTNLSISIPTSLTPSSNDEKSDSGNSSDTTITDTSISAYAISKVPS